MDISWCSLSVAGYNQSFFWRQCISLDLNSLWFVGRALLSCWGPCIDGNVFRYCSKTEMHYCPVFFTSGWTRLPVGHLSLMRFWCLFPRRCRTMLDFPLEERDVSLSSKISLTVISINEYNQAWWHHLQYFWRQTNMEICVRHPVLNTLGVIHHSSTWVDVWSVQGLESLIIHVVS